MSGALVQQVQHLPAQQQELAVSMYLEQAKGRLDEALALTGPEAVASIKAEVATAAEATKQLGLSKEIRDDATEMVRRAEYTLDKSIRKGQAEGIVSSDTNAAAVRYGHLDQTSMPRPSDFFDGNGQARSDAYQMGAATEDEFEGALAEARREANLSRANVVRKVKGEQTGQTRQQRADLIEKLAREGHSTRQMPAKVGITERAIKDIARDFNIDIPADRVIGKTRRLDSNRVLSGVTESLSSAAYSLQQIDPLDLDQEQAQEWVDSLTESLSAIRKALNPIKESLRG